MITHYDVFRSENANVESKPVTVLQGSSLSTYQALLDFLPDRFITDLNSVKDRELLLKGLEKGLERPIEIYNSSLSNEGTVLYRTGSNALIVVGNTLSDLSLSTELVDTEDLAIIEQHLQRLISHSQRMERSVVIQFLESDDLDIDFSEFESNLNRVNPAPKLIYVDGTAVDSELANLLGLGHEPADTGKDESEEPEEIGGTKETKDTEETEETRNIVHLRRSLGQYRSSIEAAYVRLQKTNEDDWGNYTNSLVAHSSVDLTLWDIEGDEVCLDRNNRYLFFWKDTGKLAFVRVVKTRLTFFGTNVVYKDYRQRELAGSGWLVREVSFDAPELKKGISNVLIELCNTSNASHYISAWFDGFALSIKRLENFEGKKLELDSLNVDIDLLESELASMIVKPFKYQKNLQGVEANVIFSGKKMDDLFELKLIELTENCYALTAEYDPD